MSNQIVGICGSGLIGYDPFDRRTWSGSSYFLFSALRDRGALHRAFGVEAGRWRKLLRMALNFRLDRRLWRQHFYLDTGYYNALTAAIGQALRPDDFSHPFLQLGAIYDVPSLAAGRTRCFSYHDGNLAETLRSPHAPRGLSARKVDRALAYERRVYHGMDRVLAMSEYLRQSFVNDFDVPAERVVNVGGGMNLDQLPAYQPDKRFTTREVLFIGVDFPRKGGWELLRAFRAVRETLADAVLHLVGPRQLNVPADLAASVVFHGFLSKSDPEQKKQLDELFRRCVLFVMPSLYEPFGIAPLEAMAHQLPCLLTNRWALREMVTPGRTGELVECGSVEDLADMLRQLLRDPERLAPMGDEARRFVLEHYTWDKVAERMLAAMGG
jgi:glycosyltransferase involved in cell wall biosynthesis